MPRPHCRSRQWLAGLTGATGLARLYDTILDADFDAVPDRLADACPPAAPAFCRVMAAVAIWWEISPDPESRRLDVRFAAAIVASEAWTTREPQRAEAWLALGASYGARAQWRAARATPCGRARRQTHHASAGAITRAGSGAAKCEVRPRHVPLLCEYGNDAFTMMRWLLLPGGDRTAGLRLMTDARDRGRIMRAEADFQLHLIYLWYEKRVGDGLDLHRDLQARYPRNPLFYQTETDILDAYFHDDAGAVAVLESLITSADAHRVNAPTVASRRARTLLAAIRSRVRR